MPGVRRLPVLTRLANGPLLNLDSQYLTGVVQVPPSLPVSGTFSVDVDGSSLLDLPFDISNEDLWILLEEQPSVSQVSVTRSGNCLDGYPTRFLGHDSHLLGRLRSFNLPSPSLWITPQLHLVCGFCGVSWRSGIPASGQRLQQLGRNQCDSVHSQNLLWKPGPFHGM